MRNCQPVLLLQILEANKYSGSVNCLRQYVNDRERVFEIIVNDYDLTGDTWPNNKSRDAAKQLVLRILFNGTAERWMMDHRVDPNLNCIFIDN